MWQLPAVLACHAARPSWTGALDGEVDDRGDPAEGGCARTGVEGVAGLGAAERHLHVGVRVDRTRDHVLTGGVDRLFLPGRRAGRVEGDDLLAVDEDVRGDRARRTDDRSTLDQVAHGCTSPS
jgi:hypothetical protein